MLTTALCAGNVNRILWHGTIPFRPCLPRSMMKARKKQSPERTAIRRGFKENEVVGNLTEFTGRGRRLYATHGPSLGRRHLTSSIEATRRSRYSIRTVITKHLSS